MNYLTLITASTLAASIFFSPAALASKDRGGGDAIVCYSDTAKTKMVSVKMFDLWEQKIDLASGNRIAMGSGKSAEEKVRHVLSRLAKFDTKRAERYQTLADEVFPRLQEYLVDDVRIAETNDHKSRVEPKAPCYRERFALQSVKPFPHQPKFLIDRSLYESALTSDETRAALMLHEIIYVEAIEMGQLTSDTTRYFNFFISSDFLDHASANDYVPIRKHFEQPPKARLDDCHEAIMEASKILSESWTTQLKECSGNGFAGKYETVMRKFVDYINENCTYVDPAYIQIGNDIIRTIDGGKKKFPEKCWK